MSNRSIELGQLVINNPRIARKRIKEELERNKGNVTWMSEHLGVGRVTIRRWINKLGLESFVDKLRDKCKGEDRRIVR